MSAQPVATVREHAFLFQGPMVLALLRQPNPKTQTRRIPTRRNAEWGSACSAFWEHADFTRAWVDGKGSGSEYLHVPAHALRGCPMCVYMDWERTSHRLRCRVQPGDHVWVKETWLPFDSDHFAEPGRPREAMVAGRRNGAAYRADCGPDSERIRQEYGYRWRPSIFMPRWASRITLEVTEVRIQRLQEISEEDARAEAAPLMGSGLSAEQRIIGCDRRTHGSHPHTMAFAVLWDTINDERAPWVRNPWVWAVTFRSVA